MLDLVKSLDRTKGNFDTIIDLYQNGQKPVVNEMLNCWEALELMRANISEVHTSVMLLTGLFYQEKSSH